MKPLVLIPSGDADADFTYASGFPVETGLYIWFEDGDDVLVASPLEIDRARVQSKAARKLGFAEAGFVDHGEFASWPRLAARMLREKGLEEARVSPRLQAAYLEELRSAGVAVEIDHGQLGLPVANNRRGFGGGMPRTRRVHPVVQRQLDHLGEKPLIGVYEHA